MSKQEPLFDDDGLRVVKRRAPNGRALLRFEVLVVGGDWSLGRESVRRLRDALSWWLLEHE